MKKIKNRDMEFEVPLRREIKPALQSIGEGEGDDRNRQYVPFKSRSVTFWQPDTSIPLVPKLCIGARGLKLRIKAEPEAELPGVLSQARAWDRDGKGIWKELNNPVL